MFQCKLISAKELFETNKDLRLTVWSQNRCFSSLMKL